uniref:Uncharacterized protein n=1 Tax=viral metagenome TaxID=1070528 RepID=A0A6C0JQM2_9ZZZZ
MTTDLDYEITLVPNTNYIIVDGVIIAGMGKNCIRKLTRRDVIHCEQKGYSIVITELSRVHEILTEKTFGLDSNFYNKNIL